MLINKEEAIKSFKRWITQTAREQRCYEDEVVDVVNKFIIDSIAKGNLR